MAVRLRLLHPNKAKLEKTFDITIDIAQPVNPQNAFAIWRADNVAFNFTFVKDGEEFDTSGAAKLRVFAKRVLAGGAVDPLEDPLFAGDFTESLTSAAFDSELTAGDAGNYLLTVMLLDSSDNAITAQGIYFELKENGYAGIYQPSADYRDEVIGAKEAAQSSAQAAQQSASMAQGSYEGAADALAKAQSASTAAQGYAQAAADSASQASGIAGVDILKRTKAAVGGFYFNGGSLQNTAAEIRVPFSVCATIDSQYNGTIFTIGNTSAYITDGVISLSDGTNTATTPSVSNGIHALVFVITSSGAKIFADGVQAATGATFAFSPTSAGYEFWKDEATLSGRISRAKIFNFDMSESGEGYTPQDYAKGIEPSGLILAGGTSYTNNDTWTRFAASYTVVDDGGLGLTFTDPYSLSYGLIYLNASSPIPAGSTVEISCGEDIGDAAIGSIQVQIQTDSRANQGNAYVYPNGTKTNTITTTGDATRIEAWFNKDASVSSLAGKTLKTSALEVRINGATVNLADFAQGYQAQDTSANGNHAMLVGTALADKTAAQALVRGTYTWSGSTGAYWLADSNVLPANCQVELWAKSSAAATLNLGYDTGHATAFGSAKSVSTSWASVASWVMGAIPRKLFVSPSAADLSVQFYLKITSIR